MPEAVLPELPVERPSGCPFDPPAALAGVRADRPLTRLSFPDGHLGWLATGHAPVRAVLGDRRFSSRYELAHYHLPGLGPLPPAPTGDLTGIDPPEHTRLRRLLTGKFTTRRMRLLTGRLAEITGEHLDRMARQGPPVDLVEAFARPVPAVMICELLGVPEAERASFQRRVAAASDPDLSAEEIIAAYTGIQEFIGELVRAKRAEPTDDLLSDLTTGELSDDELSGIGTFLLGAGLDTTANMIALGTFALLSHPAQLEALRDEPELADNAVEELLRYLTIAHTSLRTALEDVEVDGHLVKAGETVAVSLQAANRDPAKYADPDGLDLRRDAGGHLAFAHGVHQCLGQQLARVELRVAVPALLRRFPGLRLAVAPEEIRPRPPHQNIYGIESLPVAW